MRSLTESPSCALAAVGTAMGVTSFVASAAISGGTGGFVACFVPGETTAVVTEAGATSARSGRRECTKWIT